MTGMPDIVTPLFVPGHRPDRFAGAAASGADAIILDLEDAVAVDAKAPARQGLRADFTGLPVFVRINGPATPWHGEDLAAVLDKPFAGIVLPKAELGAPLEAVARAVRAKGMALIALVETARGLADARDIAALDGVSRLAFGSIDYCADLGCAHSREVLLLARSELVLASRLAGRPAPIDGVTVAVSDADQAKDDARHARDLGFGGKLCIHPRQIAPVMAGFQPDQSEIEWARRVVASGDGAIAIDGAMVDEPVRIRARSILARAERARP
jgi:citrate lyase subunit beta/citryl-CoA lyase